MRRLVGTLCEGDSGGVRAVDVVEDEVAVRGVDIAVGCIGATRISELPAGRRGGEAVLVEVVVADGSLGVRVRRQRRLEDALSGVCSTGQADAREGRRRRAAVRAADEEDALGGAAVLVLAPNHAAALLEG